MARPIGFIALIASLLLAGVALADRLRHLTEGADSVVLIEGGWFTMGSEPEQVEAAVQFCKQVASKGVAGAHRQCIAESFEHETPAHRVQLPRYRIDRFEVSNRAYGRCVAANVCSPSSLADEDPRLGGDDHPVAGVSWAQALGFCRWLDGRLPTEAEWELAARGGSQRAFPWGRHYNSRLSNHGSFGGEPDPTDGYRYAAAVGAFADGRSAHGLLNMAGNVWEFTADRYAHDYYERSDRVDPRGPARGDHRVIRGGSWRSPIHALRVAHRGRILAHDTRPDLGFRCAYNVP